MTDPASDQSNDGATTVTATAAPAPARKPTPKKPSKSKSKSAARVATTGVAAGEAAAADWSPAELGKDGHTLVGKHPFSGPARARSLAKAGAKSDPQGLVSDEAIATAAKAAKARKA